MESKQFRERKKTERSPRRLLLWAALAGLIFGLIGFGEFFENSLRVSRNRLHLHPASGDIVLVGIDDPSLRQYGNWPWSRGNHARIVDELTRLGARRILYDVSFSFKGDPAGDRAFEQSLERSGKVTLPAQSTNSTRAHTADPILPMESLRSRTDLATISLTYNYASEVWAIPYQWEVGKRSIPSFAAKLAGVSGRQGKSFRVDYSIDPRTVPTISAADVLSGRAPASLIAGKDVVVGPTSPQLGDLYFIPGQGRMAGVYIHLLGAETLKAGKQLDLGWLAAYVLALAVAIIAASRRSSAQRNLILGGAFGAFLVVPYALETRRLFVDVTPALFVVGMVWASLSWSHFKARGGLNPVSGLPNLGALREDRGGRDRQLIAARIQNYAEIVSALSPESERLLVEQIALKLTVGALDRRLYHGDEGIFAWFADKDFPIGHHLDALHALFRSPAKLREGQLDLSVSFGVEIGSSRSLANRLGSALVAADEAAHDGFKWKYYDPAKLDDVSWKLSMLSQLDDAIESGEVWVAYQPKLDLATRRICGAEALARWTHPTKGPISPLEFISAAEQHDRIEKLTHFVLDQAIAAAASVGARGIPFTIAVNLSARLLIDRQFPAKVSALLRRHRLDPARLTLELTETSALAGSGEDLQSLARLRDLGVRISIDDYGTGLSTLDYLKKVPASEIKIDQSFIKAISDNRSDRLMVQSTIGLAHSLGHTVVAEGVEDKPTLDLLARMECDVAQGFIIGRPTSFRALMRKVLGQRKRAVA